MHACIRTQVGMQRQSGLKTGWSWVRVWKLGDRGS